MDDGPTQAAQGNGLEDILGGGVPSSGGSGAGSTNEGSLLDILDGPSVSA